MRKLNLIVLIGGVINAQTIATNGKHQYTLSDFAKAINFTEYIYGVSLNNTELTNLKQQEIKDFNENPEFALQNIANIDYKIQQFAASMTIDYDDFQQGSDYNNSNNNCK